MNEYSDKKQIDSLELKLLFKSGCVKDAVICSGELDKSDSWQLIVLLFDNCWYVLRTQREPVRYFKTLDAASRFLTETGLRSFTVRLSQYKGRV